MGSINRATNQPSQIIYRVNEYSKRQMVKDVFINVLFFPVGIAKLIHSLVGKITVPASRILKYERKQFKESEEWEHTPITIQVDGYSINGMIVRNKMKKEHENRWTLYSLGNGECYEAKIQNTNSSLYRLLQENQSHALLFNGPGIGHSSGMISRSGLKKAHKACLSYLENQENGAKAKEIICYGFSLGAGIQAEAIQKHQFKDDIKYIFIKDRTFSEFKIAVKEYLGPLGKIGELLTKITGWNINTINSSNKLTKPEIIIQTKDPNNKICHDGIISSKAALATKISRSPNKITILTLAKHNNPLYKDDIMEISDVVDELFAKAN